MGRPRQNEQNSSAGAGALRERQSTDPEFFWIIKRDQGYRHGRFRGTHPGAHNDTDAWGMTALVQQFATLPANDYQSMVERADGAHCNTGTLTDASFRRRLATWDW